MSIQMQRPPDCDPRDSHRVQENYRLVKAVVSCCAFTTEWPIMWLVVQHKYSKVSGQHSPMFVDKNSVQKGCLHCINCTILANTAQVSSCYTTLYSFPSNISVNIVAMRTVQLTVLSRLLLADKLYCKLTSLFSLQVFLMSFKSTVQCRQHTVFGLCIYPLPLHRTTQQSHINPKGTYRCGFLFFSQASRNRLRHMHARYKPLPLSRINVYRQYMYLYGVCIMYKRTWTCRVCVPMYMSYLYRCCGQQGKWLPIVYMCLISNQRVNTK